VGFTERPPDTTGSAFYLRGHALLGGCGKAQEEDGGQEGCTGQGNDHEVLGTGACVYLWQVPPERDVYDAHRQAGGSAG